MVLLQNAKPKITKPKASKSKNFRPKFEFLKEAKFKILDGQEQKIMKIDNPSICKIKFSVFQSSKEMPMKVKNYYKNNLFQFLRHIVF